MLRGWHLSVFSYCGSNMIRGLAPIVGPGHIWGVNGGQGGVPHQACALVAREGGEGPAVDADGPGVVAEL